jgi:hypothetical protein
VKAAATDAASALRRAEIAALINSPKRDPGRCPINTTAVPSVGVRIRDQCLALRVLLAQCRNCTGQCLSKEVGPVAVRCPQSGELEDGTRLSEEPIADVSVCRDGETNDRTMVFEIKDGPRRHGLEVVILPELICEPSRLVHRPFVGPLTTCTED